MFRWHVVYQHHRNSSLFIDLPVRRLSFWYETFQLLANVTRLNLNAILFA